MSMFLYRIHNIAHRVHSWLEACRCSDRVDASLSADGFHEAPAGSPLVISRWVKPL